MQLADFILAPGVIVGHVDRLGIVAPERVHFPAQHLNAGNGPANGKMDEKHRKGQAQKDHDDIGAQQGGLGGSGGIVGDQLVIIPVQVF